MKLSIYSLLIVLIVSCTVTIKVFAQAKTNTNRPAKEPYASLPSGDKLKVQKKLVAQLRVDTDFIAIEKITQGIVDDNIKRRVKGGKAIPLDRNSNTPEAKKRRDDMLDVMIKNLNLMKKYPEIGQLDSETRRAVFKEARKKKSV